jgi:hypothetical protein
MKIPFLLMSTAQKQRLQEQSAASSQISYLNTKTQNLDMCPKAKIAFEKLIGVQSDAEMKMMQSTKDMHAAVSAGLEAKPTRLKHMQFKQYVGL